MSSTSTLARLRVNAMVCRLAVSSAVISRRASSVAERRTPMAPSTSGGFQNQSRRAARGAPLRSTSCTGRSSSFSASSRGLAMVALQAITVGLLP